MRAFAITIAGTGICLALASGSACDRAAERDGMSGPDEPSPDLPPPSPPELVTDLMSVAGGPGHGPSGVGADGGTVYLASRLGIALDLTASGMPEIPLAPPGGLVLVEEVLTTDLHAEESIHLMGDMHTGGGDLVRTISSSSGDIVLDGTLRSAQLGTSRQAITLDAPQGTVFVNGRVDTSGGQARDSGQDGGAITIRARRVVVTGSLISAGAASAIGPGGMAGAIAISVTDQVVVVGTLDASGGDREAGVGPATGGAAADVSVSANGDVWLVGRVELSGGSAVSRDGDAAGGPGSRLAVDADGAVHLGGVIDARGGSASGNERGRATGGAAGAVRVGENAPPLGIWVAMALDLTGGPGPEHGGNGGDLSLTALGGNLHIGTRADLDGASSFVQPGRGGSVVGRAGPTDGGIFVAGEISASGGAANPTGGADGGGTGTVKLDVVTLTGPLHVAPTGRIILDGGRSGNGGLAGSAGDLRLLTRDGDISIAGHLLARGGEATGDGGRGGLGGHVNVFSDTNYDGIGGNLTILPEGVIDVSGGPGAIGGSARNDGAFGVARFPDDQDQIAVLLNSDSAPGRLRDGQLENLGTVIARGAATNGSGGDVVFHGRRAGSSSDPLPGRLYVEPHGTGRPGEYWAQ